MAHRSYSDEELENGRLQLAWLMEQTEKLPYLTAEAEKLP
jgi:hypothetical protein